MSANLSSRSKPAYQAIGDEIRNHIKSGRLRPSEQLPAIKALARQYNVSLVTAVRAINILKDEGYVNTTWGGGCYVADHAASKKVGSVATLAVSRNTVAAYGYHIASYWDQIFSQTVLGVQDQCARENIKNQSILIPESIFSDSVRLSEFLQQQMMDVDGVICVWHDIDSKLAECIQSAVNKPVIFNFLGVESMQKFNCIQIDVYDLACKVMQHLIDAGHQRIACIAGAGLNDRAYQHRMRGYRDTLIKNKLPFDESAVFFTEERNAAIIEVCRKCLDGCQSKKITAVFCFNDYRAMTLFDTAYACGVDVPGKLAVAGFDGMAQAIEKGITTIQLPFYQVGREATLMLDAIVEKRVQPPVQNRISSGVICNKSTANTL